MNNNKINDIYQHFLLYCSINERYCSNNEQPKKKF